MQRHHVFGNGDILQLHADGQFLVTGICYNRLQLVYCQWEFPAVKQCDHEAAKLATRLSLLCFQVRNRWSDKQCLGGFLVTAVCCEIKRQFYRADLQLQVLAGDAGGNFDIVTDQRHDSGDLLVFKLQVFDALDLYGTLHRFGSCVEQVGQAFLYRICKYRFRNWKILTGLSLELERHEVLAVLGPNGAGKSTLLFAISGLLSIESGHIWFSGNETTHANYVDLVRLGIILCPEGAKVFPEMNIEDNLLIGGYLRTKQERRKQLVDIYDLFPRLKERKKQLAGTLSGGERQMVSFGRALMSRPKLLMLDEPSFGLAPLARKTIYDGVKKVNEEEGLAILLVEQDAASAMEFAGRAYAIENGRVSMEGKPEKFMKDEEFRKLYLGL